MKDVVQLECLANGATGIWAGLCEEGECEDDIQGPLPTHRLLRMWWGTCRCYGNVTGGCSQFVSVELLEYFCVAHSCQVDDGEAR